MPPWEYLGQICIFYLHICPCILCVGKYTYKMHLFALAHPTLGTAWANMHIVYAYLPMHNICGQKYVHPTSGHMHICPRLLCVGKYAYIMHIFAPLNPTVGIAWENMYMLYAYLPMHIIRGEICIYPTHISGGHAHRGIYVGRYAYFVRGHAHA